MFRQSPASQAPACCDRLAFSAWLGAFALAGGLSACDRLSGARAAPAFKGIDITGAPCARGFTLTDFNGQARSLFDREGRIRVAQRHEQTADDRAADVKRLLQEQPA
ncbi:MAG: hypothetical protein IV088_09115 [Hydrogenophaga sp.]|uniref:hypothetical protein n=1 Tax=Hydrogenophaga sp. TaxID=1904254 RepID=UPI0025C536FF|nr:hypothetical protein [Hydrogenophaga sp.]MBT9550993.1 hypothetical protein [Hydrogenophaga sp.]